MVHKRSYSSVESEDNTMPEIETSKEFINFFVNELKEIYWVEKYQLKALPKMHQAAARYDIKHTLDDHLATTLIQLERLEQIFELLSENAKAKKCEALASLADELNELLAETEKGSRIRDTGLVLAAQKIECYEILTYRSLVQLARTMGNEDIISLLEETLSEQIEAGDLFSSLSEKNAE